MTKTLFVPFFPKRGIGPSPWEEFGSNRDAYERWIPHICGLCGLASVLASAGYHVPSLWQLTEEAAAEGVFVERPDGYIEGAYHYPLARLAQGKGVESRVERFLPTSELIACMRRGEFALLSVALDRVDAGLGGSHLVLIHRYLEQEDAFLIHDCAHILRKSGENARIPVAELTRYSNERGLVFSGSRIAI